VSAPEAARGEGARQLSRGEVTLHRQGPHRFLTAFVSAPSSRAPLAPVPCGLGGPRHGRVISQRERNIHSAL
jgi:hypothetical protein